MWCYVDIIANGEQFHLHCRKELSIHDCTLWKQRKISRGPTSLRSFYHHYDDWCICTWSWSLISGVMFAKGLENSFGVFCWQCLKKTEKIVPTMHVSDVFYIMKITVFFFILGSDVWTQCTRQISNSELSFILSESLPISDSEGTFWNLIHRVKYFWFSEREKNSESDPLPSQNNLSMTCDKLSCFSTSFRTDSHSKKLALSRVDQSVGCVNSHFYTLKSYCTVQQVDINCGPSSHLDFIKYCFLSNFLKFPPKFYIFSHPG